MTATRLSPADDPVGPGPAAPVTVQVDGHPVSGVAGQSIAGLLLAAGRSSWRTSRKGRPRGVFCGIGICHDCLVTVNGLRDVRACQRRATDGDVVTTTDPATTATVESPATVESAADDDGPGGVG